MRDFAMRAARAVLLCAPLAACGGGGGSVLQSSVLARPEVAYRSGNSIGVNYYNGGIQASFNESSAMELLAKECGPRGFKVTGRSSTGAQVNVDAQCNG